MQNLLTQQGMATAAAMVASRDNPAGTRTHLDRIYRIVRQQLPRGVTVSVIVARTRFSKTLVRRILRTSDCFVANGSKDYREPMWTIRKAH